jgi:hypothetical protein
MLKPTLNDDGTVNLSLGDETITLTSQELEEQIERLARIRAQLSTQVPNDPPMVETVVYNPQYRVRTDNMTKASLLSVRHGGYGWMHFELSPQEALNMKKIWIDIVNKLGLEVSTENYEGPERRSAKLH